MPARILVVTPDPDLQRQLASALRGEGHDLVTATTGDDGFRRWGVDRPDLMVLDTELEGMDGFLLVQRVRESEAAGTHLPMVLLGTETDVAAKVRGLRSGADDYLTKPVHTAELIPRVRSLLVRFGPKDPAVPGPVRGQIHAYYGAKGGVGTTTVAVNSAVALHRFARRKVCLVDADLQFGDHRVFLDLGPDSRSVVDATASPTIDADLLRNLVVHHESGIDVLLAPPSPESAEQLVAERQPMSQIMEALRTMYDYTVVDLDRRLDDHSLDVVTAADTVFVVMTADLSCIKNVRLVLETMGQLGLPEEKVQLLMNRSTAFTGITPKSVEAVLRRPIRYQIVNDYRIAISALNSGDPFMQNRADSVLGKSLMEFVHAIDSRSSAVVSTRQPAPQTRMVPALSA